jgi:hypothetical protein
VRPKWALTPQQAATLLDKLPPLVSHGGPGDPRASAAASCSRCGGRTSTSARLCSRSERPSTTECSVHRRRRRVSDKSRCPRQHCGSSESGRSALARPSQARSCSRHDRQFHLSEQRPQAVDFSCLRGVGPPHTTWLTFRRVYSSWSHDKGVPGKVVAQLMGHANVDTTLNVHAGAGRIVAAAVDKVGGELFTIVHQPGGPAAPIH